MDARRRSPVAVAPRRSRAGLAEGIRSFEAAGRTARSSVFEGRAPSASVAEYVRVGWKPDDSRRGTPPGAERRCGSAAVHKDGAPIRICVLRPHLKNQPARARGGVSCAWLIWGGWSIGGAGGGTILG